MKRWQENVLRVMAALIVAVASIGFSYIVYRLAILVWYGPPGPERCVPNVPRVVVDGKTFTTRWGRRGKDRTTYDLGSVGEREMSGDECVAWQEATKAEYRGIYSDSD